MTEVAADALLAEVRRGLTRDQKELSPKYFYDRRGSELFEEITRLPEYYLTRAELEILEGAIQRWLESVRPSSLVELGAGSGRKTRSILDGMLRTDGTHGADGSSPGSAGGHLIFVPVDVSADFLQEAARELRREYSRIRVHPLVADMSARDFLVAGGAAEALSADLPPPTLFALLGSTIGNFRPPGAAELLSRVADVIRPGDRFLLGVDLRPGPEKTVERLERAYNDAAGITARFNRNVLRVLNRELGTDFDLGAFRHRAFYDPTNHRMEMHLEALRNQAVALPDGTRVAFGSGETIRTEVSHKYDREAVARLMEGGGLSLECWFPGDEGLYAMAVGRLRSREHPTPDPGSDRAVDPPVEGPGEGAAP